MTWTARIFFELRSLPGEVYEISEGRIRKIGVIGINELNTWLVSVLSAHDEDKVFNAGLLSRPLPRLHDLLSWFIGTTEPDLRRQGLHFAGQAAKTSQRIDNRFLANPRMQIGSEESCRTVAKIG